MRKGCGPKLAATQYEKGKAKERDLSHHECTLGPSSTDEDTAASSPCGTHTPDSRPSMAFLLGSDIPLVHPVQTPSAVSNLCETLSIRGEERAQQT
jgi:hypothetical protein